MSGIATNALYDLIFLEGEKDGQADPVEAGELADLLITHRVPIVALNACQSGKELVGKQVGASERRPEEVRRVILRMLDAPGSQPD